MKLKRLIKIAGSLCRSTGHINSRWYMRRAEMGLAMPVYKHTIRYADGLIGVDATRHSIGCDTRILSLFLGETEVACFNCWENFTVEIKKEQ